MKILKSLLVAIVLPLFSIAQIEHHNIIETKYWPNDTYEDSELSDELVQGFEDGFFFHVKIKGKTTLVEKRDLDGNVLISKSFSNYSYNNLNVAHRQSVAKGGKVYEFYEFNKEVGIYSSIEGYMGMVIRDSETLEEVQKLTIITDKILLTKTQVLKRKDAIYLNVSSYENSSLTKISYSGEKIWVKDTGGFLKGENKIKYFNIQDDGTVIYAVAVRNPRVLQNFLRSEKVKPGVLIIYMIDNEGIVTEFLPTSNVDVYSTTFFYFDKDKDQLIGVYFGHQYGKNNYEYPRNTGVFYHKWDVLSSELIASSKKWLTYKDALGKEGLKCIQESAPKIKIDESKLFPLIRPSVMNYNISSNGELYICFSSNESTAYKDPDRYPGLIEFRTMRGGGPMILKFDSEGDLNWISVIPRFTYASYLDDRPFFKFANNNIYVVHPEAVAAWKTGKHKYQNKLAKKLSETIGVVSVLDSRTGDLKEKHILSKEGSKMGVDPTITQVSENGKKLYIFLSAKPKVNEIVTFTME